MELAIDVITAPSKDNPYIVIYKPKGLPSAPLSNNDTSALTQACSLFPEVKTVKGRKEIEYGLLHRIDTETDGLLLIATNQEVYTYILEAQDKGQFIKKYSAQCIYEEDCINVLQGFPKSPYTLNEQSLATGFSKSLSSSFRPYGIHGATVRPVTEESNKAALKKTNFDKYETKITLKKAINSNIINATCEITKGFRHQVRCHLAWLCTPVLGDKLYNPIHAADENMLFTASEIQFPNFMTGEKTIISLPDKYRLF